MNASKAAIAVAGNDIILKNDRKEIDKVYLTQKATNLSFIRKLHQERKEAETEAACANAKASQGWRANELKQEQKLALEMRNEKYNWLKGKKERQKWSDSDEIKELQQKIKYAYINKDMAMQLAEKKAQELRRKEEEKNEMLQMIQIEEHLQELDHQIRMAKEQKILEYKEDLQDQIIDHQKMREESYKALLDEKLFIDDALTIIAEEDKRDEELKLRKKKIAKQQAESMLDAKKLWIEKEAEIQREQERKIKEYLEDKEKKEKELQEANRKKEEMRLKNRLACISIINSKKKEHVEKERITQILIDEDIRQKEEEKKRQESEKKLRDNYMFKEITAKQMEDRLKKLEEEKMQDISFCQQLLEDNNKAALREQELLARKRQENIEYGMALKSVMDHHRMNKLREIESQYQEHKYEMELIENRRAMLDEERRRILKEHVGNLLGYLPKGVIRKEDLPYLDPEVRKFYECQTQSKAD